MPTLLDLAKMHDITAERAVEILEKQSFEGLSANTEITE